MYLIAVAGRSAQDRAPRVLSRQPSAVFVDRFDFGLGGHPRRDIVVGLTGAAIGGADLDPVKAVEHVELGQGDALDAAGLDRLPHRDRVEPAAAPLASGGRCRTRGRARRASPRWRR